MDDIPITGLEELDRHLDELMADPDLPLNAKLFDDVKLQLTEANIPPLIPRFLPRLTNILKTYQRDPAVLASLTIRLLGPLSFTQVLGLADEESLLQALRSPAPSANLLAMAVLEKAASPRAGGPADAAILAAMPAVLEEFIRRWLATPHVEVGEKGSRILGDLLDIDCELPPPPPPPRETMVNGDHALGSAAATVEQQLVLRKAPGHGALWRRLFHERAMYDHLLSLASGRDPSIAESPSPHQLSLAQGRLLRIMPRLAVLNFPAVSTTPHHPSQPLLHFVALGMVDRQDALMHLSLVDFFETWVSIMRVTPYSAAKAETMRGILREATREDEVLREALLTLPDRTIPEEAGLLRAWLSEIMPPSSTRVDGSWRDGLGA